VSAAAGAAVSAAADSRGPRAGRLLLYAIAALAFVRLLSLPWYPLMDTTEARYADIARRMLAQGDWVTPWFDDGVPFWGKPPLSFWATELGFTVFGVNEWGARLPHYLLGVAVAALAWSLARTVSQRAAWHTVALLAGSVLFLVSSGAVMTDMAMTLGNTMVMLGFWQAWHAHGANRGTTRSAGWLLVLGATLGLLAKGPVSVVLWGLPLLAWALLTGRLRRAWSCVPWLRGTLLVAALSLPGAAVLTLAGGALFGLGLGTLLVSFASSLGALLACYEHATFTAATVLGINPFDQFGVELGKVLASRVERAMSGESVENLDASTRALIERLR